MDLYAGVTSPSIVSHVEMRFGARLEGTPVGDTSQLVSRRTSSGFPEGVLRDLFISLFDGSEEEPIEATLTSCDEEWPWRGGTRIELMCHLLTGDENVAKVKTALEKHFQLREVDSLRRDELDWLMESDDDMLVESPSDLREQW